MPKINLLNKHYVAAVANDDDTLGVGTIRVFYVIWDRDGDIYFMVDTSKYGNHVKWSRLSEDGCQFLSEKEAVKYAKVIKKAGRKQIGVLSSEIKIQAELGDF